MPDSSKDLNGPAWKAMTAMAQVEVKDVGLFKRPPVTRKTPYWTGVCRALCPFVRCNPEAVTYAAD
jgi:hypothetical protein